MSGKESSEARKAMELFDAGMGKVAAARECHIATSTLYRALERRRKATERQIAAEGDAAEPFGGDVEI